MSTVHRAYDRGTGREVAVKISRPAAKMVDADGRTRREVDLLSTLDDPGLVAVLDAGVGDAATPAYLVTEFVDGPTLAQWIRRSRLTEPQTVRLGAAMCRTLAYIHARGIVHCDVKPANILISGSSEGDLVAPKLADFGIATAGNSTRATTNGATIGTANYLSPEQVRGDRITAATDIYSLGLVLIEAFTGALAYPGAGVTAARARLNRSAIIPHDAGRGLRAVLAEMTARDPLDRPDAGRAAGVLEEIAAGSDGSLTDEILMLGRPVTEPDQPPLVGTLNAPRRRIIFAGAAAAVVLRRPDRHRQFHRTTRTGAPGSAASRSPEPADSIAGRTHPGRPAEGPPSTTAQTSPDTDTRSDHHPRRASRSARQHRSPQRFAPTPPQQQQGHTSPRAHRARAHRARARTARAHTARASD